MLLRLARLQQWLAGLLVVRAGLLLAALFGLVGLQFSLGTFGWLLVADLVAAVGCTVVNAYGFAWGAWLDGDRSRGDPANRWFLVRYLFSLDCVFRTFVLALPIEGLFATGSLYFLYARTLEHNGVKVAWLLAAPAAELDRLRTAAEQSDHA